MNQGCLETQSNDPKCLFESQKLLAERFSYLWYDMALAFKLLITRMVNLHPKLRPSPKEIIAITQSMLS